VGHAGAPAAQALAKELRPNLPLIIVSGEIDHLAVSLIKAGARDYVQKAELARLVPVIDRVLRDTELHHCSRVDAESTASIGDSLSPAL